MARRVVHQAGRVSEVAPRTRYHGRFFAPGLIHELRSVNPTRLVLIEKCTGHASGVPHPRGRSMNPAQDAPATLAFSFETCTASGSSCNSAEASSSGLPVPGTTI